MVGAFAGIRGGWFDDVLMRVTDIFIAFPFLVALLVVRNMLGQIEALEPIMGPITSLRFMVLLFALFGWMGVARVVRGQVLALKEREFIEASRAMGASNRRIVLRHLVPNAIGPILVALTFAVVAAIIAESTLGFFGFGPATGLRADLARPARRPVEVERAVRQLVDGRVPVRRAAAAGAVDQPVRRRVARRHRPEDATGGDVMDRSASGAVLQLRDFRVTFPTMFGEVKAVRGVDLDVGEGEMVGVVGESGSGKSVTFLGLMGLLPKSARIEGSAKVSGTELVGLSPKVLNRVRGQRVAMIFQDPLVGAQPGAQDRRPDRRDDPLAPGHVEEAGLDESGRAARHRRHPPTA